MPTPNLLHGPAPMPRSLTVQEHTTVQSLLAKAGLPFDDLSPASMPLFLGLHDPQASRADTPGPLVAIAGLEPHGHDGLLRSLLVLPPHRGHGLARALVLAQEAQAARLGLRRLVLLTETTADFFRALGYRDTDRATLPDEVRASAQFANLCSASAVCLSKML